MECRTPKHPSSCGTAVAPPPAPWRRTAAVPLFALALLLAGCPGERQPADPDRPVGTEIGNQAPPITGTRNGTEEFRLATRGTGTAVVFFRAYGCGLCRERLRELQANSDAYRQVGAEVVAVTADHPDESARAARELELGFPVVSVDSATLAQWGVVQDNRMLPLPASYLLDGRGVVVFRHIGRNAADRAHDLEMLAVLRQLEGRR
jgi:peroxiredoxin